jgi:glycerol kinase
MLQAHVVRAMLEAICFQALDVLEAMKQDADLSRLDVMFVDGGACQNNLLMQASRAAAPQQAEAPGMPYLCAL